MCDDQPIQRNNIGQYFELHGVADPRPACSMPQCKGQTYADRSSLIRHLKQQHKVSKATLENLKETIPTCTEKNSCKLCNWVGLKTNRAEHLDVHIKNQTKRRNEAEAAKKFELKRKLSNQQITR